jgi:integrating conjugative element protein (TIGR03755 family)
MNLAHLTGRAARRAIHPGTRSRLHRGVCALCIAATLACALAAPQRAAAQAITNSSLYYRLGGSSPFGGTLNKSQLKLTLGMTLHLNYSCGKFDISLSWTNLLNNLKQLGAQIDSAIQAGIAALPMYILQRAEPGLYQLFQTYSAKADLLDAAALKTCQQMEAEIKKGGDPYQDFIDQAQDLAWKIEANAGSTSIFNLGGSTVSATGGGDIIAAQTAITSNEEGQKNGVPWVFGVNAGGVGQSPIQPIHDSIIAGYQVTCNINHPIASDAANAGVCPPDSMLAQTFNTPQAMSDWATKVLGDKSIYTCSQTDGCPSQAPQGSPSTGLNTTLQDEINTVTPILTDVLTNPADSGNLSQISVPGFTVSPQLLESVRRLPTDEQNLALGRLINEIAMQRTVNKALMVRSVLLTGLSIPQAAKAVAAQKDVQTEINRLTGYINDLLYEWRIRKEMTGQTALTVMRDSMYQDSLGHQERQGNTDDHAPLTSGAVQTNQP